MIFYATKETRERLKLMQPSKSNEEETVFLNKMIENDSYNIVEATVRKDISANTIIEKESGDRLLEWGCKLFYFDRKKCVQVVNFASKLTIILVDVKVGDTYVIMARIAMYMFDLYSGNKKMTRLLKRYFSDSPMGVFSALKDKSIISTLNRTQMYYLDDGYMLYDFIKDHVLQTRELNKDINLNWIFTQTVDKKVDYFTGAEKFEELLKARYHEK